LSEIDFSGLASGGGVSADVVIPDVSLACGSGSVFSATVVAGAGAGAGSETSRGAGAVSVLLAVTLRGAGAALRSVAAEAISAWASRAGCRRTL